MVEPGRAQVLYPTKHRVCLRPAGDETWIWYIMPPAPDNRVLATSVCTYNRPDNAMASGKKWFAKHRVDLLLAEKRADFANTPCITPPS